VQFDSTSKNVKSLASNHREHWSAERPAREARAIHVLLFITAYAKEFVVPLNAILWDSPLHSWLKQPPRENRPIEAQHCRRAGGRFVENTFSFDLLFLLVKGILSVLLMEQRARPWRLV
jgi:hypothetical protein